MQLKKRKISLIKNSLQMSNIKKQDDELKVLLIVGGIFTLGLLFVDFFYSDFELLFTGAYVIVGVCVVLVHFAIVAAWYISIKNWKDPNFDSARKWLFLLLVIGIATVAASKAAHNENEMMQDDIEKAKQERAL